MKSGNLVLS